VGLSPRDQLAYFDAPILSQATVALATAQILEANPDRVAIIWGQTATNSCRIGPGPNVSGSVGILITTTTQPFEVYQSQAGNLAQVAWHGAAIGGPCVISIVEVILRRWPGEAS
jgi:hypothetical protein